MGRACSTDGIVMKYIYNILVGKREGKRTFERLTRRWEGNIRMNFREIGCVCGLHASDSG
jgi:hypothetical protein